MITYSFEKNKNLILVNAGEFIQLNDISSYYEHLNSYQNSLKDIAVLIDCRKTKFDIDIRRIGEIGNSIEKTCSFYETIREAMLIDKPFETAVAIIVEKRIIFPNYLFRTFSTVEAASNWLTR